LSNEGYVGTIGRKWLFTDLTTAGKNIASLRCVKPFKQ
jgi:hypothetical protein